MRVVNKQAYHSFSVIEEYEAGIVLTGPEVKSAKAGAISLAGARAVVRQRKEGENPELWLLNMQINPYENARVVDYDPNRSRKLLISRAEMTRIQSKMSSVGLTLIPLECYTKGSWIKVKVGLVRGKKQYEKREELKKRDDTRQIQARLKAQGR